MKSRKALLKSPMTTTRDRKPRSKFSQTQTCICARRICHGGQCFRNRRWCRGCVIAGEEFVKQKISSRWAESLAGLCGCGTRDHGYRTSTATSCLALEKATVAERYRSEVNEAFAAQYLAVEKELGLDRSRTNVNGGAIALGLSALRRVRDSF